METIADSWDSGAANRELYESCSEQDLRLHAQDEYVDLPSGNLFNARIESGMHSVFRMHSRYGW